MAEARPRPDNSHNAPIYEPAPQQSPNSPPYSAEPEVYLGNRDAEGLQVDPNGAYPEPTTNSNRYTDSATRKWAFFHGSGKEDPPIGAPDNAGLIPLDVENKAQRRIWGLKRKTFVIIAVVIIIVIVGAIAGGVGGYEAGKNSKKNDSSKDYVQSGTTGMAQLPCTSATPTAPSAPSATPNIPNPYLAKGATFNMTCRRDIPQRAQNRDRKPIVDYQQVTKYTFKDCMDECAMDTTCGGVTYSANLSDAIGGGRGQEDGNCLLQNGTWDATKVAPYWFASAVKE